MKVLVLSQQETHQVVLLLPRLITCMFWY
uniref:Uncharacterized protein n=1 Tax=Vitis vinifera TaxID=29760 RepID=F6HBR8_VITVI